MTDKWVLFWIGVAAVIFGIFDLGSNDAANAGYATQAVILFCTFFVLDAIEGIKK